MNLQLTNRRQDAPVRLGNHGYRLDGDYAHLQADLHVPPYLSGQGFGIELWACPVPHAGGEPNGVKIAEHALDLPTPIGPHLHRVDVRAPLTPPQGAAEHAMVLVVTSGSGESRRLHDYANYARLQHFAGPALEGAVSYAVEGGSVVLSADAVVNRRAEGNVSGSLCLELWALEQPYAGGTPRGQRLAVAELGSVYGQYHLPQIVRRVPFTAPTAGRWHVALLLREWTLPNGHSTRDQRSFDLVYELPTPEQAPPEPATAAIAAAPAASNDRPSAKLVLLETRAPAEPATTAVDANAAAPVEPAPAERGAPAQREAPGNAAASAGASAAPGDGPAAPQAQPRLLNVHTASLEELSKLPGVSLAVAKAIVKGRPFASLDGLLSVRGIGDKTLRRIKRLLTL